MMENGKALRERICAFAKHLSREERSEATVEKYVRDVRCFAAFVGENEVTRERVLLYKEHLLDGYAVSSANSMLAALNTFFKFCGWETLCVKRFRVQRQIYCPAEKELSRAEYVRLLETAKRRKNERLCLILQTICATGIRVSELQYVTVEALRQGEASVRCKGKERRILLIRELKKKLLRYVKEEGIVCGSVFVTKQGAPIGRTRIWKEMKALCKEAGVAPSKVYPHNLRHLFARTFYGIEKDIAKLADILGHASINTTRIYVATTAEEHRCRMERMHLII